MSFLLGVKKFLMDGVEIPMNSKGEIDIPSQTGIQDITEGTNITIDKSNPSNPVISATGGGGSSTFPYGYSTIGNTSGIVEIGRNEDWRLNIGEHAIDFTKVLSDQGYGRGAEGDFSMSIGENTAAQGAHSFAGGDNSWAVGNYSFAYGNENTAANLGSVTLGGSSNRAQGDYSFVAGIGNRADAYGEVKLGRYGVTSPGNPIGINGANKVFSIGVGSDDLNRYDGLVLNNYGMLSLPISDVDELKSSVDNKLVVTKEYIEKFVKKGVTPTYGPAQYTIYNVNVLTILRLNNAACEVIVNEDSITDIGDYVVIDYWGTGTCEIVAGTATLFQNENKTLFVNGQYSRVNILKVSATEYRVFGDLTDV